MMYYFKRHKNGKILGVESNSHGMASPMFVKATKQEFDGFVSSLPTPDPPKTFEEMVKDVLKKERLI